MESNAVLELKAKNDKLKAELRELKAQKYGNAQKDLERKNLALDALHYVWCSGGCDGGVRGEVPMTAEMVAYVETYAMRLRTWFINNAGRRGVPKDIQHGRPGSTEWDGYMKAYDVVWEDAKNEIEKARKVMAE